MSKRFLYYNWYYNTYELICQVFFSKFFNFFFYPSAERGKPARETQRVGYRCYHSSYLTSFHMHTSFQRRYINSLSLYIELARWTHRVAKRSLTSYQFITMVIYFNTPRNYSEGFHFKVKCCSNVSLHCLESLRQTQ